MVKCIRVSKSINTLLLEITMRAKQFLEDTLGTNPKRPARQGSRPDRGHEPVPRYNVTATESKTTDTTPPKPRNFVAKNAVQSGAGAHKDKKKAQKQGDVKHKGKAMELAEMEKEFSEGKASRALCKSSKPDDDLGASNLASCKSQGLRARDGEKSHKLGKSPKSRIKVGGHRIKGQKYGGPLPDWS